MTVYVVADLEITNPDEFQKYGQRVVEIVKQYGGRYLIRGGESETLEANPPRLLLQALVNPDVSNWGHGHRLLDRGFEFFRGPDLQVSVCGEN